MKTIRFEKRMLAAVAAVLLLGLLQSCSSTRVRNEPPVPQRQAPSALPVQHAAEVPIPDGLFEVYWQVVELDGQPIKKLEGVRAPYLLLSREGRRVSGFSGCNGFSGKYRHGAEGLRFGYLASTRRACSPGGYGVIESALMNALGETVSQRLRGQRLELRDERGTVRVRLEAQAPAVENESMR